MVNNKKDLRECRDSILSSGRRIGDGHQSDSTYCRGQSNSLVLGIDLTNMQRRSAW
jgi:hypothetical protein